MCKIKVLYFLHMTTYEIDFWNNFERFSKAKIAFQGVGRGRKGSKMWSELSLSISLCILGFHTLPDAITPAWGGALGEGEGSGLDFKSRKQHLDARPVGGLRQRTDPKPTGRPESRRPTYPNATWRPESPARTLNPKCKTMEDIETADGP